MSRRKKTKIMIEIVYLVALILLIAMLIYDWFVGECTQYIRILIAVMAVFGLLTGKRKNRTPLITKTKKYEEAYKDILKGIFTNDKSSYKKMLKVIGHYNRNQHQDAYDLLDELEAKCQCSKDYIAVYTMRGVCFADDKRHKDAIMAYEKVLQYDVSNAMVWSNIGLSYATIGKSKEAYEAYCNAIKYNPEDENAYNNMAAFLVDVAEPEAALAHALKALEINPQHDAAMTWAAIAYKMLGDDENAKKYCQMYKACGQDARGLEATLAEIQG